LPQRAYDVSTDYVILGTNLDRAYVKAIAGIML